MSDDRYNGWTNYETWLVNLHITNDEGSQDHAMEMAQDCWDKVNDSDAYATRHQRAMRKLSDALKSWVEDLTDEMGGREPGLVSDLLTSALGGVDWDEIAESFLADVDKSEGED